MGGGKGVVQSSLVGVNMFEKKNKKKKGGGGGKHLFRGERGVEVEIERFSDEKMGQET